MGTGTINSKKRYLNNLTIKHRMLDKEIDSLYTNHSSDDILKAKTIEEKDLHDREQRKQLAKEWLSE